MVDRCESPCYDPKPDEPAMARIESVRTNECCNILGGAVARGEMPIESGVSWYISKHIKYGCSNDHLRVKHWQSLN